MPIPRLSTACSSIAGSPAPWAEMGGACDRQALVQPTTGRGFGHRLRLTQVAPDRRPEVRLEEAVIVKRIQFRSAVALCPIACQVEPTTHSVMTNLAEADQAILAASAMRETTAGGTALTAKSGGQWLTLALVTAAYIAAALPGMLAALPPGYASPVWPAAGLALAAQLVLGRRVWPGVWLGAFLVDLWLERSRSRARRWRHSSLPGPRCRHSRARG